MSVHAIARQALLAVLPRSLELPVRYAHARFSGHIEHELNVVASCVGPGDVVVDVGANVGLYSFALAKRGAHVHAFEPVRRCRSVIEAYAHSRIDVHAEALSDGPGRMAMKIPIWHGSNENALAMLVEQPAGPEASGDVYESVEVRTLDSYRFDRVDLLKIDVEGHECRVVRGARALITAKRPALLIEIEQRHLGGVAIADVHNEVQALGYDGYFFVHGKARPISQFDVNEHQLRLVADVEVHGFAADYVNNFLFLPLGNPHWNSAVLPR